MPLLEAGGVAAAPESDWAMAEAVAEPPFAIAEPPTVAADEIEYSAAANDEPAGLPQPVETPEPAVPAGADIEPDAQAFIEAATAEPPPPASSGNGPAPPEPSDAMPNAEPPTVLPETPAAAAEPEPAHPVQIVSEKPANPRRGWWQRLIQP
jgi:hypothetical protein